MNVPLHTWVEELEMLRASAEAAQGDNYSVAFDALLGAAPANISDKFSSVLGDGFHFMDRPKVPIHHECKKGYFHALQEAWFAWDEVALEEIKVALRGDGLDDAAIEAKMYYDVAYFRERVPRIVLPPSQLYRRVRCISIFMYSYVSPCVSHIYTYIYIHIFVCTDA